MRILSTMVIASLPLMSVTAAQAQTGHMMNGGGMWYDGWMGGYGGAWVPVLLAIVVVGLVAWIVRRGGK